MCLLKLRSEARGGTFVPPTPGACGGHGHGHSPRRGPHDTSAQLSVNATSPVWLSTLPRHCSQSLSVPWGACPRRLPPAVPSPKLPALCGLLPYQHPAGPAGACLRLAGHHPPALVSCAPQAPSLSCGSSSEGSVPATSLPLSVGLAPSVPSTADAAVILIICLYGCVVYLSTCWQVASLRWLWCPAQQAVPRVAAG